MRRLRCLLRALPWIAILLIIALVQVVRDAPVDAVVFGVVAVVISVDAVVALPAGRPLRLTAGRLAAGIGVAAVALTVAPRHSIAAGVVVVAVGLAALVIAWPNPPASQAKDRRVLTGTVLWAGVTVALCLLELTSFLAGRTDADAKLTHPAVSDLLDPLVDTWPGRVAFIVLWLVAGAGFVRVARAR